MSDPKEIIDRLAKAPEVHPVQGTGMHQVTSALSTVTLRAYEVYAAVYGHQAALIDLPGRGCRGGFATGELVAFLYARSFPQAEWAARVDEAFAALNAKARA